MFLHGHIEKITQPRDFLHPDLPARRAARILDGKDA
jgi:hypothetical protein